MTTTFGLSARSVLAAGVAAAAVGVIAVAPLPATAPAAVSMPALVSPAVALTAAVEPLQQAAASATAAVTGTGDSIIAAYNAIQPWVAYAYELADWALSFIPGIWWVAPAVDLVYFTSQPLVESLVYSFAYLLNGQTDLIPVTINQGVQNAANNFVTYAVNWVYSIVPLPPLPPIPSPPFASTAAKVAAPAPAAARGLAAVAPATRATDPARARVAAPRAVRAAAAVASDAASTAASAAADTVAGAAPVRTAARSGHPTQHDSRR